MKLLFDETLSPRLAQRLQSHFPDSLHVNDCGLGAASDDSIWTFARENGFVIVSKDADFQDLSVLRGDPPKKCCGWLRVGEFFNLANPKSPGARKG